MTARVLSVPCLKDNYAYLVVCEATGESAIVDASEADPVARAVEKEKLGPRALWSTHHHHDHVGGNEEIVKRLGIREVFGHASDKGRIPEQTRFLETGDAFTLGKLSVRAIHIPGHTTGAVAYFIEGASPCVFTGDTLFLAGCGRLFEGTPAMMHASLARLCELPPETRV